MIISDFAIKRPLITVVAMVALVIFGLFALFKLKTDEFPDVAPPFLTVGIVYPGASPDVVESEVLKPVEEQIGSITGVKRIIGKAYDGYSMIMIEFLFGKDLNVASQEVRDAISAIRSDLPTEMKEPIIQKFNRHRSADRVARHFVDRAVAGGADASRRSRHHARAARASRAWPTCRSSARSSASSRSRSIRTSCRRRTSASRRSCRRSRRRTSRRRSAA